MKKTLLMVLVGLSSLTLSKASLAQQKLVLVTQIVDHPALDAVAKGAVSYLRKNGFDEKHLEIRQENAQGNVTTAAQIAKKFASDAPDAIVAISTPSAQTVIKAVSGKIPVVYGAITDPVAAKIIHAPSDREKNQEVTGVSDLPSFTDQLSFILEIQPTAKTIGLLYNPGEANSLASLTAVEAAAKEKGLRIIPQAVSKVTEVSQGALRLVGKVDAIYVANDNTVATGLEGAIKVCHKHKLPLYAADILLVSKGLVGMRGPDYLSQGEQVGALVARILKGEKAHTLPNEGPQKTRMILSPQAAKKMGVEIPPFLLKKADEVI